MNEEPPRQLKLQRHASKVDVFYNCLDRANMAKETARGTWIASLYKH